MSNAPTVSTADRRGDGGFAAIEFAVLFPLVLFGVLALVQVALWGHIRATASAAAQDAAAQLAVRGGTGDSSVVSETIAAHHLQRLNDMSATTRQLGAQDGGVDSIEVRIDGELPTIFALFSLPVHAKATATVERFRG
jgi:Flp pilus assembly protein TadG